MEISVEFCVFEKSGDEGFWNAGISGFLGWNILTAQQIKKFLKVRQSSQSFLHLNKQWWRFLKCMNLKRCTRSSRDLYFPCISPWEIQMGPSFKVWFLTPWKKMHQKYTSELHKCIVGVQGKERGRWEFNADDQFKKTHKLQFL